QEARQIRREETDRDDRGCSDLQLAAGLAAVVHDLRFGQLELVEYTSAALVEPLAEIGHQNASRRPCDEARIQLSLDVAHLPADARQGEAEAPRRSGEAARLDDGDEHPKLRDLGNELAMLGILARRSFHSARLPTRTFEARIDPAIFGRRPQGGNSATGFAPATGENG